MKKVLIINTTLNKGGAARVARDIFENLNSDFDIYFAYGRNAQGDVSRTFHFGNKIEMFIHIFLVRFLGLEGCGSYFSTKKLINFIKRENFDLVNLHNLHGYYLNFFTLLNFLSKSNIPVVYSLHDEWPITWMPAHSLGCNHCKTGLGKCTNAYGYPKSYFPFFQRYMLTKKKTAFLSQSNMTTVCPSVWLESNIKKTFLGKFKSVVISNGIDTELFKPVADKLTLKIKHDIPEDKTVILFSASNLDDKSKGVDFIIKAAKLLKNKDYIFLGLGDGKIQGIENIKTTGYIYDKKDLSEFYALSDIFCFTSSAETFLLSAAEALSCAVPVCGFEIPVVKELVNSRVGILTTNNSHVLSEAIENLATDKATRESMGLYGRKLIMENYSKNIFLNNYKNLYNQTLK
jgi:glycosyltransferase involved in cell wall biosynthesis